MWSSWFEDAKKKAEDALKSTSQLVSEVGVVEVVGEFLGIEGCEAEGRGK